MSNTINADQVLAQMRVLASQAQSSMAKPAVEETGGVEFASLLKNSISAVSDVQKESGDLKKRFELGDSSVNLVDVTIASEKAKVAFTAMTEVRNKLIKTYQDVMSLPI